MQLSIEFRTSLSLLTFEDKLETELLADNRDGLTLYWEDYPSDLLKKVVLLGLDDDDVIAMSLEKE